MNLNKIPVWVLTWFPRRTWHYRQHSVLWKYLTAQSAFYLNVTQYTQAPGTFTSPLYAKKWAFEHHFPELQSWDFKLGIYVEH